MLERQYSLAQNVDRLFFGKEGKLSNEFGDLYASLFENVEPYLAIVEALGEKKIGMTRLELEKALGKKSSGTLTKRLEELENRPVHFVLFQLHKGQTENGQAFLDHQIRFAHPQHLVGFGF